MATYHIETYGCQMNLADSELISGVLAADGWVPAGDLESADLIIFNTCTVRERAAERVIGRIRSLATLKKRRPGVRLILAGCLAQHLGADLAARLPEVDLFVGPDSYRGLARRLAQSAAGEPHHDPLALDREHQETYEGLPILRRSGVNAWVSIMRGCDRACTYCAVPLARGRERSLPAATVLRDVQSAVAAGHVEITLLGQTVTSYDDGACDFAALIDRLAGVPGLKRVRFLSPHPADFTPKVLEALARSPVFARHLHLPLQSGADRILAAMRRGYTRAAYLDLVARARRLLPGLGLTTDLMVGFPGETEADYQQTLELMKEIRFDGAFMFAYSPRERTYAARRLKETVCGQEKQRRLSALIALQEGHSLARFRALIGTTTEVLIEGPAKESPQLCFGRGDDFKATVVTPLPGAPAPKAGSIVRVRIRDCSSHTLRGDQMDSAPSRDRNSSA